MTTPLRVGIIGLSRHGQEHFATNLIDKAFAKENAVIFHSVFSRSRERHAFFVETYALANTYFESDLDLYLSDPDLDCVIIASATAHHFYHAQKALSHGKHVLIEKPLATTPEDAATLVSLAEEMDLRLGVAYHMRHHPVHRAVHTALQSGAIGEILSYEATWSCYAKDQYTWRSEKDNGPWWALSSMGTHMLDLMHFWLKPLCGDITEMTSQTTAGRLQTECEEEAVIACNFAKGAHAKITVSFNQRLPRRVLITGEKGTVEIHDTFTPSGDGKVFLNGLPLAYAKSNPYMNEIADFLSAIRQERDPLASGADGLANVALLTDIRNPTEPADLYKEISYVL